MIVCDKYKKIFKLVTANTEYILKIVHKKYVAHLFYGKKDLYDLTIYQERAVDFAPYVANIGVNFSLDTQPFELSFFDSGDMKDTSIKIGNSNGDSVTLFYYKDFRIFQGRINFEDMPYSRGGEETLEIIYYDAVSECELHSYYTVFPESDTITRYAKFVNCGERAIAIERAVACQLDLKDNGYSLVTLCGEYGRERNICVVPLHTGIQSIYSKRGHSSHQFNPFIALKGKETTENEGEAYAFEFVYSGDFEAQAEKTFSGKVRVLMGLNHETFRWRLDKGESFITPETILTYSSQGMNKLSQNLHNHIRSHIIPPKFAYAARPVVVNTWEGMYFAIDENIVLQYAEKAKELGIDMVVIDDGWFGNRCNDSEGLGDWYANKDKFQNGLAAFSGKIHKMGLQLGIWIEPEMISPKSQLYAQHPEWVLGCRNRDLSLGRKQLVLDLTQDQVVNYIVERLKKAFLGVKIDYIKWDFNRSLTEVGSSFLNSGRQGEARHRFMLGSYKMHKLLTEAFPDTLFEGCSGGGGRFDAGILFYCPQIWASDNTDPFCRLPIQEGTALAYPLSAISAHVSNSINNPFEKEPDYDFRCNVASECMLGYEMNISQLSEEKSMQIKKQANAYKKVQKLLLKGDRYRIDGMQSGEYASVCVSKDKSEFIFFYRCTNNIKRTKIQLYGLDPSIVYRTDNGIEFTGDDAQTVGIDLPLQSGEYRYFVLHAEKKI